MSINWPDAGFLQMIAGGTQMLDSKLSTLSLKIQKESRFQFRELLEKFCCDYIQPDAIYTGDMNELRKIAAMAEAYYWPVVPHNCNGPVCTAASIHAAACMPNFRIL